MKRYRPVGDVSALPSAVFGSRGTLWWGTLAFMLIEGMTVAICIASYLYVRKNFPDWPPPPTPLPSLLIPTIAVVVLLASIFAMTRVEKAARRLDTGGVRMGLIIMCVFAVVMVVLRVFEFRAIGTHWDSDAYGSTAWATVGFHSTLLLLETVETAVITALVLWGPLEKKHFGDIEDNAVYWYFMCLLWIPVYLIVYLGPRFI
ncbi:MAG: heme-copper oxidase subunit III [Gemmatimonadaceae bacterium]